MDRKKLRKIGKLHPRALIAGGAGYVGTHLSKVLLDAGFEVWVLDDFSSGKSEAFSNLCSNEKFRFWTADINKSFPEEVGENSLDFIFHFARLEIRSGKSSQPLSTLITNATGTKNLLDLARRKGARFLLGSSIGVGHSLLEEGSSKPLLEAKRFAEALVGEYREEFGVNARVVRLAEVYGPGMDLSSSGSLGRMIEELLESQEITVYGEGLQKEYYIHIDDAVNGVCSAMFSPGRDQWRLAVAPEEPTTTLELAYKVRDVSALRIKIEFTKAPEPYALTLKSPGLENSKPPSWEMQRGLGEGIRETIEHFRKVKGSRERAFLAKKSEGEEEVPKSRKHQRLKGPGVGFLGRIWSWFPGRGVGFAVAFATLCIVFAIPLGQFLLWKCKAERQISRANTSFNSIELDNALQASFNAQKSLEVSESGLRRVSWVFNLVGKKASYENKSQYLRTLRYLSQYIHYTAEAFFPVKGALDTQHIPSSAANYSGAKAALIRAKQMIFMVEAELANSSKEGVTSPLGTAWDQYIVQAKNRLGLIRQFLEEPASFSLPNLRQELVQYGWVL